MQFDLSTAIYARVPLSAFGRREIDPEPAPPSKPRGRPRVLSFQQRLEIAIRWRETHDSLARRGRSTRHPKLTPILKQIGRETKKNTVEFRINKTDARREINPVAQGRINVLSRRADALGRYSQTPILPPDVSLPEVDRKVAKKTGLTERMVRKVRSDKRIAALVGLPIWVPRPWQVDVEQRAKFKRQALALITPERFEKGDLADGKGGLVGLGRLGLDISHAALDVIPGPGPRHRVGCEEFRIGGRPKQTRLSRMEREEQQARILTHFGEVQRANRQHQELFEADKQEHLEFWARAIAAWPRRPDWRVPVWGDYDWPDVPVEGLWFDLKPNAGALLYLGYHIKCRTFAHALPMGWTTNSTPEEQEVLGPHSTWPWMNTPLWTPLCQNYVEDRIIMAIDFCGRVAVKKARKGPIML
jgi:hypothetical protein